MSAPDMRTLLDELTAAVHACRTWKLIVANEAVVSYQNALSADGWTLTVMRAVDVDAYINGRLDVFNYVGAGASSDGNIMRMPSELAEVAFKLAEKGTEDVHLR